MLGLHCCPGFSHCAQAAHCGLVASVVPTSRLLRAASGVGTHRIVALQHVGPAGIRDQTRPLHWQADSLPLSHEGSLVFTSTFNILFDTASLFAAVCLVLFKGQV